MKKNILYLVDNNIQYYSYKTDKIYTKVIPKEIMKFGKIANLIKFSKFFELLLKENRLLTKVFMDKIIVITNKYYTNVDKQILSEYLQKNSYNKIFFIKDKNILNLSNKAYINFCEQYTIIYYKDRYFKNQELFIDNELFSKNELLKFIRKHTSNKDTYIFGNNQEIENNFSLDREYIFDNKTTMLVSKISMKKN